MLDRQSYVKEVLGAYSHLGEIDSYQPHGNGHINSTFIVSYKNKGQRIILQAMNKSIFKNPEALMENILNVTSYLRKEIVARGGNPDRETLTVVLTNDGKPYHIDSAGEYWRAYLFVEDVVCYDKVEKEEDFYESGYAFGQFQGLLSEYPAHTLYETIPHFHDTAKRLEAFEKAVAEDVMGRVQEVKEEIRFVLDRREDAHYLGNLLSQGKLGLRVTHNDTKLNNILMDGKTGKGICVVDLDTVMPGLALHDYGDSIRFGANTALEDEADLSKVSCDERLFEVYTKGFLKGCDGRLSDLEIQLLPMGAKVMTYECGMRFLMDYIQGDVYFKTHYDKHNLVRARNQFKLVEDMEAKWERLVSIVQKVKEELNM